MFGGMPFHFLANVMSLFFVFFLYPSFILPFFLFLYLSFFPFFVFFFLSFYLFFFLSLSLSLSCALQTYHETAPVERVREALASGPNVTLYPFNESFVVESKTPSTGNFARIESPFGFVNAWNSGTPAFDSEMERLVNDIPWQQLMQTYLKEDKEVDKRGNIQFSFGYAGGQSHQKRTPQLISENFGTSIPSNGSSQHA